MGLSHGTNDAQKTMGIIALALFTGTSTGAFASLPPWLDFLKTPHFEIHIWVKVACALTMAAGTAGGGWRIIRTIRTQDGPASARAWICRRNRRRARSSFFASSLGIPLSTTHVISTSIMGVGAMKALQRPSNGGSCIGSRLGLGADATGAPDFWDI